MRIRPKMLSTVYIVQEILYTIISKVCINAVEWILSLNILSPSLLSQCH